MGYRYLEKKKKYIWVVRGLITAILLLHGWMLIRLSANAGEENVISPKPCPAILTVDYAEPKKEYRDDGGIRAFHYMDSVELKLQIEADFSLNGTVYPEITVRREGEEDSSFEVCWNEKISEAGKYLEGVLCLPGEEMSERVYDFSVTYPAETGYILEMGSDASAGGHMEDGVFTSCLIVTDRKVPMISEVRITPDIRDLNTDENGIRTDKDVEITALVNDTYPDISGIRLADSSGTVLEPEYATEADGQNGVKYSWIIRGEKGCYRKEIYHVEASDLAGNRTSDETALLVEIDKQAPVIGQITIDQKPHNGWVKGDSTFTIYVGEDREDSPAPNVQYSRDGGDSWLNLDADGTYEDGQWIFSFVEKDVNFAGGYLFRGSDEFGNISDVFTQYQNFKKDKEGPAADTIKVKYEVRDDDTEGDYAEGSWGTRKNDSDCIWAKHKIQVTLFMEDGHSEAAGAEEGSGIDTVVYQYGSGEDTEVSAEKNEDGLPVQAEEDGKLYNIVRFTVTEAGAARLKIKNITDLAGNELSVEERDKLAEDSTLLIIDSENPAVWADFPDACSEQCTEELRKYYRPNEQLTSEKVILTFRENNYDRKIEALNGGTHLTAVYPEVKIQQRMEDKDSFAEIQNAVIEWGTWDAGTGTVQAKISLPYIKNETAAYRIIADYEDGSGNKLVLSEKDQTGFSMVLDGTYESGILVLDDEAPELLGYAVEGMTNHQIDGVNIYHNEKNEDDIHVSFTIADSEKYWNADEVRVSVMDTASGKIVAEIRELLWKDTGNIHTASFGFDGEEEKEAEYMVEISYADRAGNLLIQGADAALEGGVWSEGLYAGKPFVLDHTAPVFGISFNEAFRLTRENNKDYTGREKTPVSGMTSYYGKEQGRIEVMVTLDETYMDGISDFVFDVNGKAAALKWTKSGTTYAGTFFMKEDGDYKIRAACRDAAGNAMTGGFAVQGGSVREGVYESPLLILDTVAPTVACEYTASPVNIRGGRYYFGKNTTLKIQIEDQNIRYKELRDSLLEMKVTDVQNKDIKESKAWIAVNGIHAYGTKRGTWKIDIPLYTDANYKIPVSYTDLAGNKAELDATELVTKDAVQPVDLEIHYSAEDPADYKWFGFLFAKQKMTVTVSARDTSSGIHRIRFTVKDENGKKTVKEKEFSPSAERSYQLEIPMKASDFKGTVTVEVIDWSGNRISQTRSHIVESEKKHSSEGKAVITTQTSPGRTVGGKSFYNSDIKLNLLIEDGYSGIGSYSYKVGSASEERVDFKEKAGSILSENDQKYEITKKIAKDLTLLAASNNENNVKVYVDYEDNAGHSGHVEQLYHVDITKPVITVEYDLNDSSGRQFYDQARTATVTIRERNFHADDVDLTITNTEGTMPLIGDWSSSGSGDNTEHVCHVVFFEDGDYTFTAAFEDMAGNRAEYDRVDEFTIDRTEPELTVTYDNYEKQNGYYYAKRRIAAIDILEHNFDPDLIHVITTSDGSEASLLSGWSRSGDHNRAMAVFDADADYTLSITGVDQAGNLLNEYGPERFVVDQTAPKLEISGVENLSANNGAVMPKIRCHDINYDKNKTTVLLTGSRNGIQELKGSKKVSPDSMWVKLDDFQYVPEMDDLYTINAIVYDLAGNSSRECISFSVNRFGSVYTLDDETALLVEEYYTDEAQDLMITETNVDSLEFREITLCLNGKLRTLREDKDYKVRQIGTEANWRQYQYIIDKSNFTEEGVYTLTIYSEDRAHNVSDNRTKGKKLEFAVDRTSPGIVLSGVEDHGQYRESRREITLDIQDNLCLGDVEVTVNGEKTIYPASETEKMAGKISFPVESSNIWQTVSVTAYDAAGNRQDFEEIRFLITSNIFIQIFRNKMWLGSIVAVLILFGAGGYWIHITHCISP